MRDTARTRSSKAGTHPTSISEPVSETTCKNAFNNASAEQILEELTQEQIRSLLEVVNWQGDRAGLLSSGSNMADVQETVS
jgi:hypothetical protein